MALLFKHYRISLRNRRRWELLAWKLANDFVPALQVIDKFKKPGKSRGEWGLRVAKAFVEAVDEIRRKNPNLTVQAAIKRTRTQIPQLRGNTNSLKTRYYELKREIERQSKAPIPATLLTDFLKGLK